MPERLTVPWHVEECSDEHMENCPCIIAARLGDRVVYVADGETPELAACIVADHNAALTGAAPRSYRQLAASLTDRLAALQDGNEAAYRELYDERRGPHFCVDRPIGVTAGEDAA
jgi:hypothetical protein